MTELFVFNRLRQTLQGSQVTSVQLVPPGGQAPLSITYRSPDNTRRTVFPDFLGHLGGHIFLGELKPMYSVQDSRKLFELGASIDGQDVVRKLVFRITRDMSVLDAKIHPLLIHAGPMRQNPTGIRQLRLLQSGEVWIDDFEVPEKDAFPALISRSF